MKRAKTYGAGGGVVTTPLSCDHPPAPHGAHTTGTAILVDGREVCWSCADEAVRAAMRSGDKVSAYLASDGKTLTTWSGGKLADVTQTTVRRVGFGRVTRTYWQATGEGRRWYGCGEGTGMVTTMRAARA